MLCSTSAEFTKHFVIPVSWSTSNIADFKFSTTGLFHDLQTSRGVAVEDRHARRQRIRPRLGGRSLKCNGYIVAKTVRFCH